MTIASGWLREGERDSIGIYRRPWTVAITGAAVIAIAPALLVSSAAAKLMVASFILAVAGIGILVWLRQAAIITRTAILFRSAFGTPLEIPLAGLKRVTRVELPGDGGWIEVCRLELLIGGFFDIPATYTGKDDFVKHIEQLVPPSAHRG
jgi:hypothetical protein